MHSKTLSVSLCCRIPIQVLFDLLLQVDHATLHGGQMPYRAAVVVQIIERGELRKSPLPHLSSRI